MRKLQPLRTVAPGVDLIETLAARKQCRVDHADDDETLAAIVRAATAYLDGPNGILRTALLKQTWRDAWSGFPESYSRLQLSAEPLIAVTSVEYIAPGTTTWTPMAAEDYHGYTDATGSWVELADGESWPDTATRPEAVRITYTAGFGPSASDVPANIIHAAKLLVAHYYENREAVLIGTISGNIPMGVDALLAPWKRVPV
jgi:hypothetical protein